MIGPLIKRAMVFLSVFFLLFPQMNIAQPNYLMSIQNGTKVNDNKVEFDVFIKSNTASFILTSYQCVFTFNTAIINGGTLAFNYAAGTSQLSNFPAYGIGINTQDSETKLTFASLAGNDTITTTARRVGKFQLTNTNIFGGSGISLTWNFSGVVNTILTGTSFTNITNSNYHTDLNLSWDNIPPAILSASLLDSTRLQIFFSEMLDSNTVTNIANYSISGGVNVINASLQSTGNSILCTTTPHYAGNTYTVLLQNISDLVGNIISSTGNSASYLCAGPIGVNIKIYLQGPYYNGSMKKGLNELHFIPTTQPYDSLPWNYQGPEMVASIPQNVVDWVLVELRTALNGSSVVAKRAAFLKSDGNIVDLDGISIIKFVVDPGLYYIVVKHRNHLGIISANKVSISGTNSAYNFTSSMNSAYGSNSQKNFGDGNFGMYAGDANANGTVNNTDLNSFWKKHNGQIGYKSSDFNLNGGVNIIDKNFYWSPNKGKTTNIPVE